MFINIACLFVKEFLTVNTFLTAVMVFDRGRIFNSCNDFWQVTTFEICHDF